MVVDLIRQCETLHRARFDAPVVVGERKDGLRGLFVADGYEVPRNHTLVSMPVSAAITPSNIASLQGREVADACELTPCAVTTEDVAKVIRADPLRAKMVSIAPQLCLAIHVAAASSQLLQVAKFLNAAAAAGDGDASDQKTKAKVALEAYRVGITPYARMLDDEAFDEVHVNSIYSGGLDPWQVKAHSDLVASYNAVVRDVSAACDVNQYGLNSEDLRRLGRIIIARADALPSTADAGVPRLLRPLTRRWRRYMGVKEAPSIGLFPYLDLVNHSNRPNVVLQQAYQHPVDPKTGKPDTSAPKERVVKLVTLGAIKGGIEVCRHYNFALDRAAALFRYGFLPFETIGQADYRFVSNESTIKQGRDAGIWPDASDAMMADEKKEASAVAKMEQLFQNAPPKRQK